MKIALNEIIGLCELLDNPEAVDNFLADIEETDDYANILDEMALEYKHILADKLREAMLCKFDTEILSIDHGMDSDLIELLQSYEECELEVKL